MLSLEWVNSRLDAVEAGAHDPVLIDEAEAFLTQMIDVGLLDEAPELSARIERLRAPGPEALSPLYEQFNRNLRHITRFRTRREVEKILREEPDAQKRRDVLKQYRRELDYAEAYPTLLEILKRRGPDFAARRSAELLCQDPDRLIHKVAATLQGPLLDLYGRTSEVSIERAGFFTDVFAKIEKVFEIRLIASRATSYHPDVEVFEIHHPQDGVLGIWHIDAERRPGKYRGAWTQTALSRRQLPDGTTQVPLVFVGYDFEGPTLSAPQARTFLHELGHALEHVLNRQTHRDPPPDAREIASLYLETWLPELRPEVDLRAERRMDLTYICLLSGIDRELHRRTFSDVDELRAVIPQVEADLGLRHPLIVPDFLTIFEHAFADGEYAGTYYAYLAGYVYAHALSKASPKQFHHFWQKTGPLPQPQSVGDLC